MRKLYLFVILPFLSAHLFAQQVQVLSSTAESTLLRFSFSETKLLPVETQRGRAFRATVKGGTSLLKAGVPDLEKLSTSILIPNQGQTGLEIISSTFDTQSNVEIAPSKGNLPRTINPADVPFQYGEVYSQNSFYPSSQAELSTPYILRDFRGQTVLTHPFQYNPVTKELRVCRELVLKVVTLSGKGINELNRASSVVSPEFRQVYKHQFENYDQVAASAYTPVAEQGEMLIIAPSNYMTSLQPFIDWKNQCGIKTTVIDVATIGNSASTIKTYIANFYAANQLTFILLAGDAAQVTPSQTTAGVSDNDYAYIVGTDHYPDCFIGRFSAETTQELDIMINRSISYERNPAINNQYAHCLGIGSQQGPGDDNEMDHEHQRNIGNLLLTYTYSTFHEMYDGSQGGNDAAGDPSAMDVSNAVNAGIGIINYTGHGSSSAFSTSGFSGSNVDVLTNTQVWPFIISVACVNGDFMYNTCFAEHWLRAHDPVTNAPTGAVAVIMSTINQSWSPPMEAQDEMNAILTESDSNNIKRSFGGITMSGCMKMNDTYGAAGEEITDTWVIFGDPSLTVRTKPADMITVTHSSTMVLGANSFTVSCSVDGAMITVWQSGQLLGSGVASGGTALINLINPSTSVIPATVTATAFNYAPYQGTVNVIPPNGPYVQKIAVAIVDPLGNNNADVDYAESFTLDVTLQNIGITQANTVAASLTTTDPTVTIIDATETFGNISASGTQTQANAFGLTMAADVQDQHTIPFTLAITDANSNTWINTVFITAQAPVLQAGDIAIDDVSGNGNGVLDPGETVNVLVPTSNTGHSNSLMATGSLSTTSSLLTINNPSFPIGSIVVNGIVNAVFSVTVSGSASISTPVDFSYSVSAGSYSTNRFYQRVIGVVKETFESNSLTNYPWTGAGDLPWFTTIDNAFDGIYSSKSGAIDGLEKSELQLSFDVLANDSISFWYAVSSEANYDQLQFYIDNVMVGQWSGLISWTYTSFPITAGYHSVRWVYTKDYLYSDGMDCAWIDDVKFPPFDPITVGINESSSMNNFTISPNPANDLVTFLWNADQNSSVAIQIYDATGRLIAEPFRQAIFSSGSQRMDWRVGELPAGVYIVRFSEGHKQSIMKLVKQ